MSGHSKWASIKHKKAALDAKRGKLFTKIIKEITVAARQGGDPSMNPRLRTAIDAAKAANMPAANIERAIKKGTGELPGTSYEEIVYEGYGPGGCAIIVYTLTDNKNRTVSDIRRIFDKHNGSMGESGCVSWMFKKRGVIRVPQDEISEDELFEKALNAGADDISDEGDVFEVYTDPSELHIVAEKLKEAGVSVDTPEIADVPQSTVKVTGKDVSKLIKLMDALEEHDDVQKVSSNFDIPDEELESLEK